jgi:hypothetical protein
MFGTAFNFEEILTMTNKRYLRAQSLAFILQMQKERKAVETLQAIKDDEGNIYFSVFSEKKSMLLSEANKEVCRGLIDLEIRARNDEMDRICKDAFRELEPEVYEYFMNAVSYI